jgi:GNAT superfamily N-acetyltransferase
MSLLEVRPFESSHLPDAGRLLARRHQNHRQHEPLLDERFENSDQAELEVRAALVADEASGAIAFRGADAVAFVVGGPKPSRAWGPNIWVEAGSHAAADPEAFRDTYALAAQRWFDEGRTAHYAVVPNSDEGLVSAWFRLGFGQQHVHAIRESNTAPTASSPSRIRRAERSDIPRLAALDLVLPQHQDRSPVFSGGGAPTVEEMLADWQESFDDDRFVHFVATVDGSVAGFATGCALALSSSHQSLAVPPAAGFLGYAAVEESARGLGLGRDLGSAVIDWSGHAGFSSVVTDWRVTNLLSSRAWPRLGFRPTFLRLHRNIGRSG